MAIYATKARAGARGRERREASAEEKRPGKGRSMIHMKKKNEKA
jgi:hypothetical protein